MRLVLVFASLVMACEAGARNGSRYAFYRSMRGGRRSAAGARAGESRRVFGGAAAALSVYPAACVLLDRYWAARCSASVVASRWALTAAHCVSPHVAYVKFNARRPAATAGTVAPVHYLYRHPGYKVVQEDQGHGVDVTVLHNDVGLVRTRSDMKLHVAPKLDPMQSMRLYIPKDLKDKEVQVLGFGRTEKSMLGEELFEVRLRVVPCQRIAWYYCMCGEARARSSGGSGPRGVCSGDSGGPVLYQGVQVGVTSMGPLECSSGQVDPAEGATSVFTSLYNYADLVNATIYNTEAALRMRIIGGAVESRARPLAVAAAALLAWPSR